MSEKNTTVFFLLLASEKCDTGVPIFLRAGQRSSPPCLTYRLGYFRQVGIIIVIAIIIVIIMIVIVITIIIIIIIIIVMTRLLSPDIFNIKKQLSAFSINNNNDNEGEEEKVLFLYSL